MQRVLKEIAVLCNFNFTLETHKARRTFASTVTLKNGVPMNIVKEMLGHASISQTEEYAITEEVSIGLEMKQLSQKLSIAKDQPESPQEMLSRIKRELLELESKVIDSSSKNADGISILREIEIHMAQLRNRILGDSC